MTGTPAQLAASLGRLRLPRPNTPAYCARRKSAGTEVDAGVSARIDAAAADAGQSRASWIRAAILARLEERTDA